MSGKILSIDDSMTVRKIISTTLSEEYGEVLEAGDTKEALSVLKREGHGVKLMILDVNMPGMDGLEFLENLKAIPIWANIPVIMLTTESKRETVLRAVRAGASNYLVKPFTKEELLEKVVQTLA